MLSSARVEERLARRTLALVLAGGRGSRLKQLTDRRAKPAVFFGGKFRIIDFALSNCLNSNIRRIAVLTQYKAHSLLRHLQMGWSFLRPEMNEFLDLIPAQQRLDEATWYRGTADAVYQNFDILKAAHPDIGLDAAGDCVAIDGDLRRLDRDEDIGLTDRRIAAADSAYSQGDKAQQSPHRRRWYSGLDDATILRVGP